MTPVTKNDLKRLEIKFSSANRTAETRIHPACLLLFIFWFLPLTELVSSSAVLHEDQIFRSFSIRGFRIWWWICEYFKIMCSLLPVFSWFWNKILLNAKKILRIVASSFTVLVCLRMSLFNFIIGIFKHTKTERIIKWTTVYISFAFDSYQHMANFIPRIPLQLLT